MKANLHLMPHFAPIHARSSICKHCGQKGSDHKAATELSCPEIHIDCGGIVKRVGDVWMCLKCKAAPVAVSEVEDAP